MSQVALNRVRIVLVEPAGPLNVGSIARVMKNMGLSQLVLVQPQCDPWSAEARQMAVHAADVLEAARVVADLPEGLQGCQRAIATTGRPRTLATALEHPRVALPWLFAADETEALQSALIFGPEDRGLNNEELNYAQRFVYIPSNPVYPSLNLAQAVAICSYELHQCAIATEFDQREPSEPITPPTAPLAALAEPPAALDVLEAYYQHLEAVLLQIGYLYPHTATSRMQKFRRLFSRALPSTNEVALLQGILSQVEWAIQAASRQRDS
jgi:tRNA/rRNA methyltransferase